MLKNSADYKEKAGPLQPWQKEQVQSALLHSTDFQAAGKAFSDGHRLTLAISFKARCLIPIISY